MYQLMNLSVQEYTTSSLIYQQSSIITLFMTDGTFVAIVEQLWSDRVTAKIQSIIFLWNPSHICDQVWMFGWVFVITLLEKRHSPIMACKSVNSIQFNIFISDYTSKITYNPYNSVIVRIIYMYKWLEKVGDIVKKELV